MTPIQAAKIACLLYPHLNKIAARVLSGSKDAVMSNLFSALVELPDAELLILDVYCCLIGVETSWFVENATATEMFITLPVLNEVHRGLIDFVYDTVMGLLPLRSG